MLMKMESGQPDKDIPIPDCVELDTIGASLDQLARDIEEDDTKATETIPRAGEKKPGKRLSFSIVEDKESRRPLNGNASNHVSSSLRGGIDLDEFARFDIAERPHRPNRQEMLPRLTRKLRGGYCVILCALGLFLVVALILGLAIYLAGRYQSGEQPGGFPHTPGRALEVRGEMRIVGGPFATFSAALQDGESAQHIYTVQSFTFILDNLFSNSDVFKDIYSRTEVSNFKNGSLVIDFIIYMETIVSPIYALTDEMTELMLGALDSNNNLGVFTVEPDSLFLYIEIPSKNIKPLPSPTPYIPSSCEPIHLPICHGVPYNYTSFPSVIGHKAQIDAIEAGLRHLDVLETKCHEYLELFWCVLFEPPCENDAALPPCKEFCLEIESFCPGSLDLIEMLPGSSCASLPSQSEARKCYSKPNPKEPRCEDREHEFCPGMYGGGQTIVPNLLGHQSQAWAEKFIREDLRPLDDLNCSPLLRTFGCSLLSPSCVSEGGRPSAVPPCRELCLLVQQQCGFFMELSDAEWALGVNCSQFPAFSAGADRSNSNRCLGGRESVFSVQPECDGHRCDEDRCVPRDWVCDGQVDCDDTTDERQCARCIGEFKCNSGICLNRSVVCDGKRDCSDGEDEQNCVRLAGRGGVRGTVEAYSGVDLTWRPVCAQGWTEELSHSVCKTIVGSGAIRTQTGNRTKSRPSKFLLLGATDGESLRVTAGDCPRQRVVEMECNIRDCGLVPPPDLDREMPARVPWLVSLHGGPGVTFYCGGTLISRTWILTAAHCLHGLSSTMGLRIRAGSVRRDSALERSQERRAAQIYVHPDYDPRTLRHDVALVRVTRAFHLDTDTRLACLPSGEEHVPGREEEYQQCFMSGWGKVSEQDKNYRREAEIRRMTLVPREDCVTTLEKSYPNYPQTVDSYALCARGCEGADACPGDSGGALTCWDPGTQKLLTVGVVSWGIAGECGNPLAPGVYAGVAGYSSWINHHLTSES